MIHKSFRAHGEYRSSTRAELRDTQMRSRGSSFCRRVMATTNSTAVDMTEVRQIKAQSLGAAAIAKAFGIGRFIRGAKPQAGLRQTDYFEEVIKRLSLCASAGGAAFLKHYTRRSDSRPGARELGACPDIRLRRQV